MAEPPDKPDGFLRRWSQRKLAAAREAQAPQVAATGVPQPQAAPLTPASVGTPAPQAQAHGTTAPAEAKTPLPDVASLTFDSDFRAFLSPEVEEGTRRAALRKLFGDPRFNVQDGLDVYIDDYNKFEPITPEVLKQLAHARYVLDPPKTRINERGWVEDVPEEAAERVPGAGEEEHVAAAPGSAPDQGTAPVVEAGQGKIGTEACQNPSEVEPPGVLPGSPLPPDPLAQPVRRST